MPAARSKVRTARAAVGVASHTADDVCVEADLVDNDFGGSLSRRRRRSMANMAALAPVDRDRSGAGRRGGCRRCPAAMPVVGLTAVSKLPALVTVAVISPEVDVALVSRIVVDRGGDAGQGRLAVADRDRRWSALLPLETHRRIGCGRASWSPRNITVSASSAVSSDLI